MSTHNICFSGEIRKNIMWIPSLILELCVLINTGVGDAVSAVPDLLIST